MRNSSSLLIAVLLASTATAQPPAASGRRSVHREELTASDFRDAITRAQGTCLLPFGGSNVPRPPDDARLEAIALKIIKAIP